LPRRCVRPQPREHREGLGPTSRGGSPARRIRRVGATWSTTCTMAGGNSHGVCGAFLAEGDKGPDLRFAIFKQKAHAPAQARDASKPPEISTPDRHPERRPPFSINGARRLAAPRAMVCQFELGRDLTTSMSNLNSGKPWSDTDLLDLKPAPGIRRPPSSLHPPFVHLVVAAMVRSESGLRTR
jgi:hypothetical protein